MATKKRKVPAGGKCKMIPTKTGKKTRRCWNAKGKFIKTPTKARKRK